MSKGPQKRHQVLSDQIGCDVLETLCSILVIPVRDEKENIMHFRTRANNKIQIMFDTRGVSCSTCQFIWKNIKGAVRG